MWISQRKCKYNKIYKHSTIDKMATQNLRSFRKHQTLVLFHPERDKIEAIFIPKLVITCSEVSFNSIFKIIFREKFTYPMNWHLIRIYPSKLSFMIFDPLKLPFNYNRSVVEGSYVSKMVFGGKCEWGVSCICINGSKKKRRVERLLLL